MKAKWCWDGEQFEGPLKVDVESDTGCGVT